MRIILDRPFGVREEIDIPRSLHATGRVMVWRRSGHSTASTASFRTSVKANLAALTIESDEYRPTGERAVSEDGRTNLEVWRIDGMRDDISLSST